MEYPKVFVVGCPRSGTTWVADLLRHHPDVIGGRESHLYPTIHGSIGTRGRISVTGWARLFYSIERGARLDRQVGPHHYVDRHALARLGRGVLAEATTDTETADRLVRAVFDEYFVTSGGTPTRVLVEKTPLHILYAERILSAFPEAHLIEVVRDGRDVCVSMQMRRARIPAWPADRRGQIDLWVRSVRHGLALRRDPNLAHRITLVRYEDLKRDPTAETVRLHSAAGLDPRPDVVASAVADTDISRFSTEVTGQGRFHFRGEIGTWIEHFSTEDTRLFQAIAGDLLAEVGYLQE